MCAPSSTAASPVRFSIGGSGDTAMRKVELWADGHKVAEQLAHAFSDYSFLDASVPLTSGSHSMTVYAVGWDDSLEKKTFTLNVSGTGCSLPSSTGINVCSPVNGSTVSSPVHALASSTVTGTLARMELWVDGVKRFTTTSRTLDTSVALGAGSHRFSFYAVNTAGTKLNKVVFATVH